MRAIVESRPNSSASAIRFTLLTTLVLALVFCASMQGQDAARAAASVRPLITQTVDEAQLTTLKGNTHPLARAQFDLGTAEASLPMQRMLLVLKRSPEQETTLRRLLDDQQSKASNKKIRRPAWVWKYANHKRQSFAAEKSSGGVHRNLTLAAIGLRGWNRIYRFQVGDAGK